MTAVNGDLPGILRRPARGGQAEACHSVILSLLASGGISATPGLFFKALAPGENADTLLWAVVSSFGDILLEFRDFGP